MYCNGSQLKLTQKPTSSMISFSYNNLNNNPSVPTTSNIFTYITNENLPMLYVILANGFIDKNYNNDFNFCSDLNEAKTQANALGIFHMPNQSDNVFPRIVLSFEYGNVYLLLFIIIIIVYIILFERNYNIIFTISESTY